LLVASICSWVAIFGKRRLFNQTRREMEWFEDQFWSGGNLGDIYTLTNHELADNTGIPAIFSAGYEELRRQRQQAGGSATDLVESVRRAMRVAMSRELEAMEGGLVMLATIGSVSPYVGLFGTVWGIMNAFIGLGDVSQASLAMVAPGIAEALIATAMGLFAAIPAVVAYNHFSRKVDFFQNRFHNFMEEMTGIVERGLRTSQPQQPVHSAEKAS